MRRSITTCQNLSLRRLLFIFDVIAILIILIIIIVFIAIIITRSYAALQAADLALIVRPGCSSGGYILGCSQHLASCLWHSARTGPGLLCQCHPSSFICPPLDWIVGPYDSLGWVRFEGKYIFELAF